MLLRAAILLILFLASCSFHGVEFSKHTDSEEFKYASHGATGDLYLPPGAGPFPAVVLIHGGSWAGGKRSHMAWIARRLVKEGFVVFNISYRLVPDYLFPAQLDDCKDAVRWLRQNAATYNINPDKIGAFGYSAGAQLAALLGTLKTDKDSEVQAVVAGSGPHNLVYSSGVKAVKRFLGTSFEENPEIFKLASPLYSVSAEDPPFLIYHGTYDELVDVRHSVEMNQALKNAGVKSELYLVEGYGHISLFVLGNSPIEKAVVFLKTNLSH